jgi:hypothetical protein
VSESNDEKKKKKKKMMMRKFQACFVFVFLREENDMVNKSKL